MHIIAHRCRLPRRPSFVRTMSILRLTSIILIGLVAGSHALAQVKLNLEINTQDELGSRLVAALQDSLRNKRLFQISPDPAAADVTLRVGTLDPMDGKLTGLQTVYSLVITMKTLDERRVNVFVNSYLGVCGREQTEQCGATLADAAEVQVSEVLSALKKRIGQSFPAPK